MIMADGVYTFVFKKLFALKSKQGKIPIHLPSGAEVDVTAVGAPLMRVGGVSFNPLDAAQWDISRLGELVYKERTEALTEFMSN